MQLAPIPLPPITNRSEAAQALIAVPMGVAMTASMTAMGKAMAGEAASRADLLAPLLAQASVEDLGQAMRAAIAGALAVAPDIADRSESLYQAAHSVTMLLRDASTDETKGDAQQSLGRLMTPLEPLMRPLMEAAILLDPSVVKPKG